MKNKKNSIKLLALFGMVVLNGMFIWQKYDKKYHNTYYNRYHKNNLKKNNRKKNKIEKRNINNKCEFHRQGFYEKYIKRVQDCCCAGLALIVLSPIMVVIALLVHIRMGSPVIFRQIRPGLNGKPFALYKFRTMTDEKDKAGNLLPDSERMTDFGRWLRSTSLDELPELVNILKGDMSVVGPRPLLMQYLPLYNPVQARRHEVRPGFTGYAQVHGRNSITWEEKFEYDVHYVDHITFCGDWKIIFQTVVTVLKREGISSETATTMEAFCGTPVKEDVSMN